MPGQQFKHCHYSVNFKWVKYSAIKNCNLGEFEFAIALMKKVKRFPMCSMHCALHCARASTVHCCVLMVTHISSWRHLLLFCCIVIVFPLQFALLPFLYFEWLLCIFLFQIFHFLLLLCLRSTPRDTQRVPPERRLFFSSPSTILLTQEP